ncbi:radical SAM protein [Paenibacillus sp. WQ 127069]|uniref:Radical SAM protein n=2 Tax=Paenibacillus baimaensis TaxID=2982185 RepID=A0ABT2UF11_9BACL|nr:4Fe-4S single cluster domain-containing protein [Paenibacillus sp. WQ 127069]MCU6793229.1 radical SAM protein [Paenibacillus sp. WQ 127069]
MLHTGVTPYSLVNGPGLRAVIHMQGCSLGCKGCFNPASHEAGSGIKMSVGEICKSIPDEVEGVTLSGGEPFQQPDGLLALVWELRQQGYSIIVFSGYTKEEIAQLPKGRSIMQYIDVLIDGRYDVDKSAAEGLRGSANQVIHLLTDRYQARDLLDRLTELTFLQDGTVTVTGFPPSKLQKLIKHAGVLKCSSDGLSKT